MARAVARVERREKPLVVVTCAPRRAATCASSRPSISSTARSTTGDATTSSGGGFGTGTRVIVTVDRAAALTCSPGRTNWKPMVPTDVTSTCTLVSRTNSRTAKFDVGLSIDPSRSEMPSRACCSPSARSSEERGGSCSASSFAAERDGLGASRGELAAQGVDDLLEVVRRGAGIGPRDRGEDAGDPVDGEWIRSVPTRERAGNRPATTAAPRSSAAVPTPARGCGGVMVTEVLPRTWAGGPDDPLGARVSRTRVPAAER